MKKVARAVSHSWDLSCRFGRAVRKAQTLMGSWNATVSCTGQDAQQDPRGNVASRGRVSERFGRQLSMHSSRFICILETGVCTSVLLGACTVFQGHFGLSFRSVPYARVASLEVSSTLSFIARHYSKSRTSIRISSGITQQQ